MEDIMKCPVYRDWEGEENPPCYNENLNIGSDVETLNLRMTDGREGEQDEAPGRSRHTSAPYREG